jgi:hypothetical protein
MPGDPNALAGALETDPLDAPFFFPWDGGEPLQSTRVERPRI